MILREIYETSIKETVRDYNTPYDVVGYDDFDFMIDLSEPMGKKIKGYDVWVGDRSALTDKAVLSLLIKDPDRDGFLGALFLNRDTDKHVYSQSFIVPEIQGRGIAVDLYRMAIIDYGYVITSDETQTRGSELLWQKLSRMPDIDVYLWNSKRNTYHNWDPDEDQSTNAYYDQNEIEDLKKEKKDFRGEMMTRMLRGDITKSEFKKIVQKKFDMIDSYIESLSSVNTDNVLLVAMKAGSAPTEVKETSSSGSTSAGAIASVANTKPKMGKYGAPEAPQKKNKDGTVKNALDSDDIFQGGSIKRIKK